MPTHSVQDLHIFSDNDSVSSRQLSTESPDLESVIEYNSQCATMIADATTQLLLASFEERGSDNEITLHEKAEQIAYDLGYFAFTASPKPDIENPFDPENLQQSWDNGYTKSAIDNKNRDQENVEKQVWEHTIGVESQHSQYSLAALSLFTIAEQTNDKQAEARAKRLAREMMGYTDTNLPSVDRQEEIDAFLSQQAHRLSQSIEL